jgi:glycosyltransferase involved in cell wall biosynthesis
MNIAIVVTHLGSGGAEKLVVDMAPVMSEKGNDVEVVVLSSHNDVFSNFMKKDNVKLTFLSNSKSYWKIFNLFKLYKILKNKDYIYSHVVQAQYFTAIVSIFLPSRIKLATTEHSTYNRRRDKYLFKFIEKFIYSRYDKIVSITEQVKSNLLEHLKIKENNDFLVIENGVNLETITSAKPADRSKFNYTNKDVLIIMIGRFSLAKDQKTLIKAISILNNNYKLLLVGEGELMQENIQLAQNLKISDRVNFLGFRSDIPKLIKMCDIGVLSSHWEGQPLSAIEIMGSEIPFVGSKVSGITELAENYGVLFPENNEAVCADEILKLSTDNEYYKSIVKKCILRSKAYSINIMVDNYLNIFK